MKQLTHVNDFIAAWQVALSLVDRSAEPPRWYSSIWQMEK
jgi:hypothetical protein